MNIVSTLLPAEDGVVLMVLDTLIDGRSLFVGLGQGRLGQRSELLLSEVGQRCFDRLLRHSGEQDCGGRVHVVEIKRFNRVEKLIREAFIAAHSGDAVFLVCADAAIYDAVFAKLNIQGRPGLFTAH